ncbi:MAG: DUF2905 domain-containing protein [Chlorobiaceae bacterium]|nr:DUF2905 domain-containing protein [Chlorobiaceae bacterium]
MFSDTGKMLVISGLVAVFLEVLLLAAQKEGFPGWLNWFGRLPLDFSFRSDKFGFYFPLGSSLLLSAVLSILVYLFNKFIR